MLWGPVRAFICEKALLILLSCLISILSRYPVPHGIRHLASHSENFANAARSSDDDAVNRTEFRLIGEALLIEVLDV